MALELVDLKRTHLIDIYPRIRGDVASMPFSELMPRVMIMSSYGYTYAAVDGPLVVAIGGVMNGGQGTGQLWIIGTTDIPKYAKAFTRLVRDMKDPTMKALGIHRLQAEVLTDEPSWIRWAQLFGMEKEGILRQYTLDKRDCVMMSYIIKEEDKD